MKTYEEYEKEELGKIYIALEKEWSDSEFVKQYKNGNYEKAKVYMDGSGLHLRIFIRFSIDWLKELKK